MHLHFDEFLKGVFGKINTKTAEEVNHEQVINSSIFPTIESQQTWKFAKNKKHLKLHDGNVIHTFSTEEMKEDEDFPVTKTHDTSYFEFHNDSTHSGTAQVHRSNPGMIYVTLHDGEKNPTYTISHVSENSWRASPKTKHKTASDIDLKDFAKGLSEKVGFDIAKGLDSLGNSTLNGVRAIGNSPMTSALIGTGIGGAYDLGRRALYNTQEENDAETGQERILRWAVPGLLAGGIGQAERAMIPNHYDGGPLNDATNPASHTPNYLPGNQDNHLQKVMSKASSFTAGQLIVK